MTTIDTLNNSQIRDLQRAAGEAGDLEQVTVCRLACGDEETASDSEVMGARRKCLDVIQLAESNASDRAARMGDDQ